jgi:hypothetical protein
MRWGSRCYLSFSLDCTHEHTQKTSPFFVFRGSFIFLFLFLVVVVFWLVVCLLFLLLIATLSTYDSRIRRWIQGSQCGRRIGAPSECTARSRTRTLPPDTWSILHYCSMLHTHTHMTRFDDSPVMYSNITQDIQLSII